VVDELKDPQIIITNTLLILSCITDAFAVIERKRCEERFVPKVEGLG
jgi:hypothetical protein